MARRISFALLCLAAFFYFGLFFAQKSNPLNSDIGRYIKNGEGFKPLRTNYYSYTEPDFPVITHHWGSNIVYFVVWKLFGFVGLSILNILLAVFALFLFICAAGTYSNRLYPLVIVVVFSPMLAMRAEVRPELFSYVFLGLYTLVFFAFLQGRLQLNKLLPILFVSQLLWTNVHIFFFMGFVVAAIFFVCDLFWGAKPRKGTTARYLLVFGALTLASLINPWGIRGLLEPLNIFRNYGYMIVENQSPFFMQKRFGGFVYFHFELAYFGIFILMLSYLFSGVRPDRRVLVAFFLAAVFGGLGLRYIRAIPAFGFFALVFYSSILYALVEDKLNGALLAFCLVILLLGLAVRGHYYSPIKANFGLGLARQTRKSIEFFNENKLQGPIFNNYDIGSYLIFNLFPKEKVFVDNRPEAYSTAFFEDTYIPVQESEDKWQKTSTKYKFNVIYFYRHDATPWAQPFLIKRLQDAQWIPVYVDDYTLILVKNNDVNKGVIEKYRLPEKMFVISTT